MPFISPVTMPSATKEVVVTHDTFSVCKVVPWVVLTVTCSAHGHDLPRPAWRFECYNTLPEGSTMPGQMSATLKLNFSELSAGDQTTAQTHFNDSRQLTLNVKFGTSSVTETLTVNLTP